MNETIEVSRPYFIPQEGMVFDPNLNTTSADTLFLYPQGARIMTKEESKWLDNLDTFDKISIGFSSALLLLGAIDLLARLQSFLPILVDLLLIGGGFSLLATSILMAKRIGLQ